MSDGDGGEMTEESTDKELSEETAVTMLAESDAIQAGADRISEALAPLFDEGAGGDKPDEIENESDEDEEEDDEMDKSADEPEANFAKGYGTGGDSAATAKHTDGDSGLPSYQAIADQNGGN